MDVACVHDGRFWSVEIKWTGQLRLKALKQIARNGNGEIWGKSRQPGEINGVKVLPLPIELQRVGDRSVVERGLGGCGVRARRVT